MKIILAKISIIILLIILLNTFQIINVNGTSMYPTLDNNQKVLILKIYKNIFNKSMLSMIDNNDIIVFKDNRYNTLSIKRYIGDENSDFQQIGNKIIVDGKSIYLNNNKIYMFKDFTKIPNNGIIVLGDNLPNSCDSRDLGFIAKNLIWGKVLFYEKNL